MLRDHAPFASSLSLMSTKDDEFFHSWCVNGSFLPWKNTPQKWRQKAAGAGYWRVCRVWSVWGVTDWMWLEGAPKWWIMDAIMRNALLRPWWRHISPERARKRSCRTCKLSWQNSTNLGGQPKSTFTRRSFVPESNGIFAPENGWLEEKSFAFLGPGPFSGAFAVSFREGSLFLNPLETKKYRNVKAKTLGQGKLGQRTDWNTFLPRSCGLPTYFFASKSSFRRA